MHGLIAMCVEERKRERKGERARERNSQIRESARTLYITEERH